MKNQLNNTEALLRANRLIEFMADYIGKMAPRSYSNLYADLNEHFLFMEKMKALIGKDNDSSSRQTSSGEV